MQVLPDPGRRCALLASGVLALFVAAGPLRAQQLPFRSYSTTDGLAGDQVLALIQDARGFLWIGTSTGLSRFDGLAFKTFGTREGLPHPRVNSVLQTRDGTLWVATAAGLARLDPDAVSGQPPFAAFPLPGRDGGGSVLSLHEDARGRLWIGAFRGLFVVERTGERDVARAISLPFPTPPATSGWQVLAFAEDAGGSLWIATPWSLVRRLPDGRMIPYRIRPTTEADPVRDLQFDSEGRLWIVHWGVAHGVNFHWAVYVLAPRPISGEVVSSEPLDNGARRVTEAGTIALPSIAGEVIHITGGGPLGDARIHEVSLARDGAVWLATERGAVRIQDGVARPIGAAQGLDYPGIALIREDRDGNMWLGSGGGGLRRLLRGSFVSYGEREGLAGLEIRSLFEDRSGDLCATGAGDRVFLARFDGTRFRSFTPRGTEHLRNWGWGFQQTVLQDRAGEWWIPTGEGLYRYPAVEPFEALATTPPRAVYTRRHGLGSDDVFRLFEDSRGDIWIGTFGAPTLQRWRRETETIEPYPEGELTAPTAFAEDSAGNVWIGFYGGGLARWRQGRIERFAPEDGMPRGFVFDLHVDGAGRLWIASGRDGLFRIDDPSAPVPRADPQVEDAGLASGAVLSLAEDASGRIYAGTARGIDRLDPSTGAVRHFSTADGLANNYIGSMLRDRNDDLWAGTPRGISRLTPGRESGSSPTIVISGVEVAGEPHPVSQLGEVAIADLDMDHDRSRLRIDYAGIGLTPGEVLRYQTRLDGLDPGWGAPSPDRAVVYGNLGSGSYRFLVRAVNAEGLLSAPASVAFTIHPPFWRRGWFLVPLILLLGLAAFAVHRYRIQRLLEIERVRTRIATDLHDDLGARLSRISILSEVAARRVGESDREAERLLREVGFTARGLIDAAGDIAWTIDPRRGDVRSLIARVRRFAADVLDGKEIAWRFDAPADGAERRLSADERRHLLLFFQEAIHNAVRHAKPGAVALALRVANGRLQAEVTDDGFGFDPGSIPAPGGLLNMQERAQALGGSLSVDSSPGHGTRVVLDMPLR